MDKELILATAETHWDAEEEEFVTRSPHADYIVAFGDTEEETLEDFKAFVDIHYQAWREGKHAILNGFKKVGRPETGRLKMTTSLKPDIKHALDTLAKLHHKSRSEIIEILIEKLQRNEVSL